MKILGSVFSRTLALVFLGLCTPAFGSRSPVAETPIAKSSPKKLPTCVTYKTRARYVSGFNHLVIINNACESPAICTVSTDVNPEELKVRVAPKSSKTVLTYRGSPAREFKAELSCQLMT